MLDNFSELFFLSRGHATYITALVLCCTATICKSLPIHYWVASNTLSTFHFLRGLPGLPKLGIFRHFSAFFGFLPSNHPQKIWLFMFCLIFVLKSRFHRPFDSTPPGLREQSRVFSPAPPGTIVHICSVCVVVPFVYHVPHRTHLKGISLLGAGSRFG